jgi:hypothetical protein
MKRNMALAMAAFTLPLMCLMGFSCLPMASAEESVHTHTLTYVGGNESSCLHYGNVEFYICTKCGNRYSDEEGTLEIKEVDLDPISHEFVDNVCTLCGGESDGNLVYVLDASSTFYTVQAVSTQIEGAITIPEEYNDLPVCRIGEHAFSGCTGLTSIFIPENVGGGYANMCRIGRNAFDGCTNLEAVYYFGDAYTWDCIFIEDNNAVVKNDEPYFYSPKYPYDNRVSESYQYWHYDTDGVTPIVWEKLG